MEDEISHMSHIRFDLSLLDELIGQEQPIETVAHGEELTLGSLGRSVTHAMTQVLIREQPIEQFFDEVRVTQRHNERILAVHHLQWHASNVVQDDGFALEETLRDLDFESLTVRQLHCHPAPSQQCIQRLIVVRYACTRNISHPR